MTIRMTEIRDIEKMLDIYTPYILETPISFELTPPSLEEFQNRVTETLKKFPWLVCEIEGQVVGYAYAGPFKSRCAYEWLIFKRDEKADHTENPKTYTANN